MPLTNICNSIITSCTYSDKCKNIPASSIFAVLFMAKKLFGKDTYLKWYESMLLMRKFEERAGQLYGMQKIRGFCHLYIGQEAVVAGAISALRPEDAMITAYRDHGHALAKGISANAVM